MKIALIHSDAGSTWTPTEFDDFATNLRDGFLRSLAIFSDDISLDIVVATPATELPTDTVRLTFGKTEHSTVFSAEIPRGLTLPSGNVDFKRVLKQLEELTADTPPNEQLPSDVSSDLARWPLASMQGLNASDAALIHAAMRL